MKPSVSRLVHYSPGGNVCWAALVTAVDEGPWVNQDTGATDVRPSLCVEIFPPMREPFRRCVFEGAPGEAGTWHWPERVE